MTFVLLGTDYREVPLEDLDRLSQVRETIESSLVESKSISGISGAVILSTCNRFELYLDGDDFDTASRRALEAIAAHTKLDLEYCRQVFKTVSDATATQHLFSVAAGLKSMVIGEEEIAGQVKRAFTSAQQSGNASTALVQVFQKAAEVAKKVTTETGLGSAGRSTITVALDFLERRYGSHEGKRALLIGTGAHARVVVAALKRSGVDDIAVFSPTGRAQDFALSRGLTSIDRADLSVAIAGANLLVSCSGNAGDLLTKAKLEASLLGREGDLASAPLLIIDVSLSRDVSPEVAELEQVELVNLEVIKRNAPVEHGDAILAAQHLVSQGVEDFEREKLERNLGPFVAAIRGKITLWIDEEVDRVRLRDGDAAAEATRENLTASTNQMLHEPITKAKSLAATGDEDDYRKALLALFGDYSV
jgi:glutamyl-tRNA reductase